MAFGQQNGPPASARQVDLLLTLLRDAGYAGFRDARGPMGFTQRQGLGKFTGPEATAFIEQLQANAPDHQADEPAPDPSPRKARSAPAAPPRAARSDAAKARSAAVRAREARQADAVREYPAKVLAVELERRGWILIPPEDLTAPEVVPPDPD